MTSNPPSASTAQISNLTFTADEVPEPFREKFILTGYRNPCSTATGCMGSAFYWTNETINIWTHLLPAFYFLSLAGYAVSEMWRSDDLYLLPLCIYACSVSCYPLASATAHIFNAMSPRARHICFFIDYWALCVYGFGSALSYRAYSLPNSFLHSFSSSFYLPLTGCVAVAALALSCHTRIMPPGNWCKFVRFASFAFPYFVDLAPMVYRLTVDGEGQSLTADFYHRRQYAFAGVAAVFYCSHAPECWWPGHFDLIGHSHQIFHVFTVIGSRDQLIGLWLDAEHTSHHTSSSTFPLSTPLCLLQLFLVLAGMVLVMIHYIYKVTSVTCAAEEKDVSFSSTFTFKASNASLSDEPQPKPLINGAAVGSTSAPTVVKPEIIGKEKFL